MGAIYNNATLNTAATGAANVQEGLFLERKAQTSSIKPCRIFDKNGRWPQESRPVSFPASPNWTEGVLQAPLSSRGWVLQERTFSKLMLHFGKDAIFWECASLRASEFRTDEVPGFRIKVSMKRPGEQGYRIDDLIEWKLALASGDREQLLPYAWYALVASYSQLGLTVPGDRLPALSSLASEVNGAAQDRYIAGIRESSIIHGLMWQAHRAEKRYQRVRPASWVAPSWPWASATEDSFILDRTRMTYRRQRI
jgi:hypothetical protein